MASPESQATDSHRESSTFRRRLCPSPQPNHDELLVVPSGLPHEVRHNQALTEASPQLSPGTTSGADVMPLSHPDPGIARTGGHPGNSVTSSPVVSLASFPSTATYVPADAPSRQIPLEKDAEVPIHKLGFEHLTRRLITTYFIYFLCGWGDGG
jgi:hypothetical protein